MGQIPSMVDLTTITDTDEFMRGGSRAIEAIVDTVNGNLEFEKNIKSQIITLTFSTANADQGVMHRLNKTGVMWAIVTKYSACDIWLGTTPATTNTIYLQCTNPVQVTLLLF